MSDKEYKTEMIRISSKLVEYIKYIQKRYKEEYNVNIEFTEASSLLAGRSKEVVLFK